MEIKQAALQIDPDLRTLRYKLVPKQMNEDVFWTKYFALCIRAHNLAAAEYVSTAPLYSCPRRDLIPLPFLLLAARAERKGRCSFRQRGYRR